jgi:hypothetical protein
MEAGAGGGTEGRAKQQIKCHDRTRFVAHFGLTHQSFR